jgi:hypothetical protein
MSTSLDLSKLSLMDALDFATLIEEEARQRYEMFASQLGRTGGRYNAGSFFKKRVILHPIMSRCVQNHRVQRYRNGLRPDPGP